MPFHTASRRSEATHLNASSESDSGTDADIDDIDPVPITLGRNRNRRHLVNERSKFRRAVLMLIKEELDGWKGQDAFLQGIVTSFMEGRKCGKREKKEIALRLLEMRG